MQTPLFKKKGKDSINCLQFHPYKKRCSFKLVKIIKNMLILEKASFLRNPLDDNGICDVNKLIGETHCQQWCAACHCERIISPR